MGDILLLRQFGRVLDQRGKREEKVRDLLIESLLKVRSKGKGLVL